MKKQLNGLLKHNNNDSLSKKISKGAFWVSIAGISGRFLDFLTAIILARLLAPEDFGLLAIALSIIAFSKGATQTGFDSALIQKQDNVADFLNTAWSFEVIRGVVLAIIIFIASPIISVFFNDPRIVPILRVLSITFILLGLKNIGIIWFKKNLDFRKQFVFETVPLIIKIIVVIPLAIELRSVWALVWANIIVSFSTLLISYILHPHRPKLDLNIERAKELFNFGKWILGSYFINMFRNQGLTMFIGRFFNLTILGFYNRADAFTRQLFFQIIQMFWKLGYPAYSQISTDSKKLKVIYLISLKVLSFIAFPLIGGLFILSWEFTHYVLTDKWIAIVPLLKIFCLTAFISFIQAPCGVSLQAMGKPEVNTKINLWGFGLFILCIYPLSKFMGITGTVLAVFISTLIITPIAWYKLSKLIHFTLKDFLRQLIYPFCITILMISVITLLKQFVYPINSILDLLIYILIGAIIYVTSVLFVEKFSNVNIILLFKLMARGKFDYKKITI